MGENQASAAAPTAASVIAFAAESLVDEYSSAWLYRELALRSKRDVHRERLEEFARYEDRHAQIWRDILEKQGAPIPKLKPLSTHRWWVRLADIVGVPSVMPLIHRNEVDAIAKYVEQEKTAADPDFKAALRSVIPDEVTHEVEILETFEGEKPGQLRSIVLGANDGLGSILALVAGVAGAVASSYVVLVAGIAGLVAGAVSMALSNYISVKTERQGRDARAAVQRVGVTSAPEIKKAQLATLLEARGLSHEEALTVADRHSKNPEEFLKAILREGYGLGEASFEKPGRLALFTGVAFLIAGAIPVIPFFFLAPTTGLLVALALSAGALFAAGVLKSLQTLGPMLKSGVEMMFIGLGSAAATYALGTLIGQTGL
jgi:VIT1/CCC1 family predicted Fe2+/Mn2+ transporter